jgi:hypothetical protein
MELAGTHWRIGSASTALLPGACTQRRGSVPKPSGEGPNGQPQYLFCRAHPRGNRQGDHPMLRTVTSANWGTVWEINSFAAYRMRSAQTDG